jgi:hypothetical protein
MINNKCIVLSAVLAHSTTQDIRSMDIVQWLTRIKDPAT